MENTSPNSEKDISLCYKRDAEKCGCDDQKTDYDYFSIMHYGSFQCSSNNLPFMKAKYDVIDAKGKNWGRLIPGHRTRFSANDVQDINDKYGYPT